MLNIAVIKEKLTVEFADLKDVYMKAYKKAKEIANNETSLKLQVCIHLALYIYIYILLFNVVKRLLYIYIYLKYFSAFYLSMKIMTL